MEDKYRVFTSDLLIGNMTYKCGDIFSIQKSLHIICGYMLMVRLDTGLNVLGFLPYQQAQTLRSLSM